MPRSPDRRGHLVALVDGDSDGARAGCVTPQCRGTGEPPKGLCRECLRVERWAQSVDVVALAPLVCELDALLEPIGGLSAALRDRISIVAAMWLHNTDERASSDDLAQAVGHGLLDAALLARRGPRVIS